MTFSNDFRCSVDAGRLVEQDESLHCQHCGRDFPVKNGIFDFRCGDGNYYFNPVPREDMAKLNQLTGAERWPETIRQFVQSTKNADWLDNLVVDGRYSWKLFLDLKPESVVLDLGCGLGNLTSNIAPHVARVFALDRTYERLEFASNRFAVFNPDDDIVVLAGGDTDLLPFPDDSMDCVILSGVLEWVGEGDDLPFLDGAKWRRLLNMLTYHFGARGPRALQLRFLKEIRRILRPSGQLFVAIENRFSYEYFGGRPDHHSGLMFGSLLPRFLANVYSIAKARTPYRTYTYSIGGYERLLGQAGFAQTEFLGLKDGYSDLREILPAKLQFPQWRPPRPSTAKELVLKQAYSQTTRSICKL